MTEHTQADALIIDAVRTPIGRYAGALSGVRADDLAAIPLKALIQRHPELDWKAIDDVILGCANQAGEDNRNVAHMASLLAGLPIEVPGTTINRLCGSGLDAIGNAARALRCGEAGLMLAGGVESMSRAPFVMGKSEQAFGRAAELFDNVAQQFGISRADQDAFALRSQHKAAAAQARGRLAREIVPVEIPQRKGPAKVVEHDEHPRGDTTLEQLARLGTPFREGGSITAGNASGVNDGACALLLASSAAARRHGLKARGRIVGMAVAGVEPRLMGIGPVPATRKVLELTGLSLADMDVIELNEAFAAQGLAVLRELGLADDDARVNRNGGAIALGHPLGMSGARLVTTALHELEETAGRYALCTMCIGVGQGIAMVIERL